MTKKYIGDFFGPKSRLMGSFLLVKFETELCVFYVPLRNKGLNHLYLGTYCSHFFLNTLRATSLICERRCSLLWGHVSHYERHLIFKMIISHMGFPVNVF
uniref:Uncharacterized protein n=1 Tax=Cacopsylla melanoneura TaxID=428564 RepID=A0A8D8UVG6_9HEMI